MPYERYRDKDETRMKRRKSKAMLALTVLLLGLTGCAENQIPDMTGEEIQAMGEFVAFTLMKYDAGHQSRLMELPAVEESEIPDGTDAEARPEEDRAGKMDPVDDTPVVGDDREEESQTPEEVSYTAEEVMGLPEGVTVAYKGHACYDSYPAESDAFAVSASEGKKLLVVEFSMTNTLAEEQRVDLLSSGVRYRIRVNEAAAGHSLPTMLLNDMSSYVDTLEAGATVEVVLLVEVDQGTAESISSIVLSLKNESKSHTIQLYGEVQSESD